ncbi:MAG: T9SS type A sorting domain-containing protein [Ignavibacteriaceae bacterium]|nr:T9SS type A sorting domain-containing protein [Ignavibacteriaceae bacterium]
MKKIILNILFAVIVAALSNPSFLIAQQNNEISELTAQIVNDKINIVWNIVNQEKINLIHVEIKRPGNNNWELLKRFKVKKVTSNDNQQKAVNYSYQTKVKENGVYYFRIVILDESNLEINTKEIKVGVTNLSNTKLYQNNPNPFNPSTTIPYEVLSPGFISLKVYNLAGKEVAILVDEFKQPGKYSIRFDVNDYVDISSGIYLYKLQTPTSSDIKKMIFAK